MSWWKAAKPGDKVVCVNGDFRPAKGLEAYPTPEVGSVYTITSIIDHPGMTSTAALVLGEIDDPWRKPCYCPTLFRPVQTKSTETGMAILKSILNGARVPEDA